MARGRLDNNINLLRLLAASAVVVAHCAPVAYGPHVGSPAKGWLGVSLGEAAVHVFFLLSGLLVARSAMEKDFRQFAAARLRRIYPGMIACTLATVLVAGLFLTNLSPAEFFAEPLTVWHLLKNLTLFTGVAYSLPGVLETNPYGGVVNGSLWTISLEIQMYAFLAVIVAAARLCAKRVPQAALAALCAALALTPVLLVTTAIPGLQMPVARCILFFLIGAFVHAHWGGRIPRPRWFVVAGAVLLLWSETRLIGYTMLLPPIVIWLAYAASPVGRPWARWPDLSYGIYLYGFPVQQTVKALLPGAGAWGVFWVTALVLVPIATMSWYWIESPFLRSRSAKRPARSPIAEVA